MPRTTDLPERILTLLEDSPGALTVNAVAKELKTAARTARTHLIALTEDGKILREFVYVGDHGAYEYRARPGMRTERAKREAEQRANAPQKRSPRS